MVCVNRRYGVASTLAANGGLLRQVMGEYACFGTTSGDPWRWPMVITWLLRYPRQRLQLCMQAAVAAYAAEIHGGWCRGALRCVLALAAA